MNDRETLERALEEAYKLANDKNLAHGSVFHAVVRARDAFRALAAAPSDKMEDTCPSSSQDSSLAAASDSGSPGCSPRNTGAKPAAAPSDTGTCEHKWDGGPGENECVKCGAAAPSDTGAEALELKLREIVDDDEASAAVLMMLAAGWRPAAPSDTPEGHRGSCRIFYAENVCTCTAGAPEGLFFSRTSLVALDKALSLAADLLDGTTPATTEECEELTEWLCRGRSLIAPYLTGEVSRG